MSISFMLWITYYAFYFWQYFDWFGNGFDLVIRFRLIPTSYKNAFCPCYWTWIINAYSSFPRSVARHNDPLEMLPERQNKRPCCYCAKARPKQSKLKGFYYTRLRFYCVLQAGSSIEGHLFYYKSSDNN